MIARDRRQLDASAALTLCIVRVVGSVALFGLVGAYGLIALQAQVPNEVWMLIGTCVGSLGGFLTRDSKHHPGPNVGPVENLTVEAEGGREGTAALP